MKNIRRTAFFVAEYNKSKSFIFPFDSNLFIKNPTSFSLLIILLFLKQFNIFLISLRFILFSKGAISSSCFICISVWLLDSGSLSLLFSSFFFLSCSIVLLILLVSSSNFLFCSENTLFCCVNKFSNAIILFSKYLFFLSFLLL